VKRGYSDRTIEEGSDRRLCAQCGERVAGRHRYCAACGHVLAGEGAAPAELAAALDAVPVGVILLASDGRIRTWNATMARLTGIPGAAAIGDSLYTRLPTLVPHRAAIAALAETGEPFETDLTGEPFRGGGGVRIRFRPLCAPPGAGVVAIVEERITATSLDPQMMRSERLAAVGELAAGVAHNFNNILAAIGGDAQLLKILAEEDGLPEYVSQAAAAIYEETMRGGRIASDLLSFARGAEPQLAILDARQLIQDAVRLIRNHPACRNVTIEQALDDDLPAVEGDANQLHQVFFNLILNALQAMPNGGILTISARSIPDPNNPAAGILEIKFSDTGIGIPQDQLHRIFDPFYTRRHDGSTGSGLGLTVSLAMVKGLGGDLTITSAEGLGTTVTVSLPIVERRSTLRVPAARARGRILLVDDDASVRRTMTTLLTRRSYEVFRASHGEEALRLFDEALHTRRFDLAVIELHLPRIDGAQITAQLRRLDPDLPVIVLASVAHPEKVRQAMRAGARLAFAKPLNFEELIGVIELLVRERRTLAASISNPSEGGGPDDAHPVDPSSAPEHRQ